MGRFVVIDRIGKFRGSYRTEAEANEAATDHTERWPNLAPTRVHPLGPALPGPAPVKKALGQVAQEAWLSAPGIHQWDCAASAVIAAHEAGKEWEVTERFAVYWPTARQWLSRNTLPKSEWQSTRAGRTLFDSRSEAEDYSASFAEYRIVPVRTRRRRVVKS